MYNYVLIVLPAMAMVDELVVVGGGIAGGIAPAPSANLKNVGHVRSVFPETWLWTNTTSG